MFCLGWLTLMSYLRMSTHPAIFTQPLTHAEAVRNVEALMSLPHCRVIGEQPGYWDAYLRVTADVPNHDEVVSEGAKAAKRMSQLLVAAVPALGKLGRRKPTC